MKHLAVIGLCALIEVTKSARKAAGRPATARSMVMGGVYTLSLAAPRSVTVGATFEVRVMSDMPAVYLDSAIVALLKQNGKPVWWITDHDAVRALLSGGNGWTPTPRPYYGPWTFKAPPEAGTFDLCMEMHGGYGGRACAPLEVTAA